MPAFTNDVAEKVLRVLQSANRLDPQKLAEVRKAGASSNADILERMIRGKSVDEGLVHQVLSKAYSLRRSQLTPVDVDERALKLVPMRLVDDNRALPFAVDQRFLRVGIVDPHTASQAGQFKSASNLNIEFQLITLSNFEALRRDPKIRSALEAPVEAPKKQPVRPSAKPRRVRFALDNEELVPEVCDHILHAALDSGTSDIHIEPFRDIARVRFRIDGRLDVREEYSDYLMRHYLGIVTRFKIMADCDISERRLPQDGGITIRYRNEDIDFRFNVLPGKNGERIVMRILKGDPSLSLTKLGFSDVS